MSETTLPGESLPNEQYVKHLRELGMDEASIATWLRLSVLTDVNFIANKFVNVVDFLRNVTGINFNVNWAAMEAAGVEQDIPVNLCLHNVALEQVVRCVMDQVGACSKSEQLGFCVRGGIVHISTKRDLSRCLETRQWNVRHLLHPAFSSADTSVDLSLDLLRLLADTIGEQSEWKCYGGEVSHADVFNGILTVKTTPEYQIDVARFLQSMSYLDVFDRHVEDAEQRTAERPNSDEQEADFIADSHLSQSKSESVGKTPKRAKILARLEEMRNEGRLFPGYTKAVKELSCSRSTIHDAVNSDDASRDLKDWMRTRNDKDEPDPRAVATEDKLVGDRTQTREPAPSDVVLDDDVEIVMAQLIKQAKPDEVVKLKALSAEERRSLVSTYQQQQHDDEPSPVSVDPPDRKPLQVKAHKRV